MVRQLTVVTLVMDLSTRCALGAGHGPVFGLATPTNSRGGWSVDLGLMGRAGPRRPGAMLRAMLSYGITADFQLSLSAPVVVSSTPLAPARITGMMPASGDFETIAAWRFHRRATGVGRRFETTAYGGLIVPGPQRPAGMLGGLRKAPGFYAALATGMASRSHYLWGGLGSSRFVEARGDRRPNVFLYSLVWGYRPQAWRKEYPQWDWRFFVEMMGEKTGRLRHAGAVVGGTDGHQIFLGPALLGIYKNYAVEAGVQFPVFRHAGSLYSQERFRVAVNLSYFF